MDIVTYAYPRRLYRYRPIDTLDRDIGTINQHGLWMAPYKKMNDPMEGYYEYRTFTNNDEKRAQRIAQHESTRLRIFDEKMSLGICCFNDSFENDLLWAHYASKSEGFCIAYNTDRLIRSIPKPAYSLVRIFYSDRTPEMDSKHLSKKDPSFLAKMILSQKKTCWSYEREWRIIGPCNNFAVTISKNIINCIYFGVNASKNTQDIVMKGINIDRIHFYKLEVNGYKLQRKRIER